jgi:hypothetical protein
VSQCQKILGNRIDELAGCRRVEEPTGFAQLMGMHKFCDLHSIAYKTRADLRRDPPSDYVRFCFGDPAHADAFMAEFGGERITIAPSPH